MAYGAGNPFFGHSERSEESLFDLGRKHREILRFAQNDTSTSCSVHSGRLTDAHPDGSRRMLQSVILATCECSC